MLYYCLGGGYGHLTRYLAFCHSFSITPELITANSDFIAGARLPSAIKVHVPDQTDIADQQSFSRWLEKLILEKRPRKFFIDAFPGGILGELCDLDALNATKCIYLARLLKWPDYQRRISGKLPGFSQIWRLETLTPEHQQFVESCNCPVKDIELIDPVCEEISDLPAQFWLVIHSVAGEELEQLWHFALETAQISECRPFFIVVSPGKRPSYLPPDVLHLDVYPASSLIRKAEKVFSAAGFNICRQMATMRKKHHLLPMARSLDDQFLRAARIKEKTDQSSLSSFSSSS